MLLEQQLWSNLNAGTTFVHYLYPISEYSSQSIRVQFRGGLMKLRSASTAPSASCSMVAYRNELGTADLRHTADLYARLRREQHAPVLGEGHMGSYVPYGTERNVTFALDCCPITTCRFGQPDCLQRNVMRTSPPSSVNNGRS